LATAGRHDDDARSAEAEPRHRRRRLLVPASGQRGSALLVDYDGQIFKHMTAAPRRWSAVHGLIQF
jgi:hypothetical protein